MDIHDSPVTCCYYLSDCPTDLVPALYSVGKQGKRNASLTGSGPGRIAESSESACKGSDDSPGVISGFSQFGKEIFSTILGSDSPTEQKTEQSIQNAFSSRDWPLTGGNWGEAISSSHEIIITGCVLSSFWINFHYSLFRTCCMLVIHLLVLKYIVLPLGKMFFFISSKFSLSRRFFKAIQIINLSYANNGYCGFI